MMANMEDSLMARLYRADCPEPAELGEYHLGLLAPERVALLKTHLAGCPHCAREVAQLQTYLADLAPDLETSLVERAKVAIARLLPRPTADATTMGGLGLALRGEETIGPQLYEAGEAQLSLEVQPQPDSPGRYTLLGLLLGVEPAGITAHLWQADQPAGTAEVDEIGNFTLGPLERGRYQLILSGPSLEIHVQELMIP
jgi:hypothetical protein